MPGLESRSVVVDADADRAICGVVSDLGGGVERAGSPSRSKSASSDEAAAV